MERLYLLSGAVYRIRTRTVSHRRAVWQKAVMAFVLPTGMKESIDDVKYVGQRGTPWVSIDHCHLASAQKLPASPLRKRVTRAQKLLELLAVLPGATTKELAHRMKAPPNNVNAQLNALVLSGKVRTNQLRVPGDTWTVRRQWWLRGAPREPWYLRTEPVKAQQAAA